MAMYYLILIFMCLCTTISCFELDNICHYNYDYNCAIQGKEESFINQIKLCTIEQIPKEVNFNIISDEKNSSSRGVINVGFKAPHLNCKYKVALFVNPYINNSEDCKKYQFNKENYEEIHTLEKTVCPRHEDDPSEEKEDEIATTISTTCKENVLSLWYEYIYTGCYALGFKLDKDYVIFGHQFLKTEYKKVEVTEPNLRCTYESTLKEFESSVEMVTIAADISLLAGSSGLRLEVAPSLLIKDKENICDQYSKNPVATLLFGMSLGNDTDIADNNCTLSTTTLPSGDLAKRLECSFVIQNSLKDVGYCFFVHILDERCHKNTSWKPPLGDKIPCAWSQYCMKTEVKRELNVEEIKKIDDLKSARIPRLLCLLLFLTIVIVIAILSTAFIFYRVRTKQTKNSSSRKMKNDFDDDSSTVLELGTKSQKEKLVKESGIVILYVRESDQFMTLMSEFKKCLRKHTDCDIYDWWAPDSWNEVARIGGYEWVVKMIRKDCRVIWIDTLKARSLFSSQHKNGYNKLKHSKIAAGFSQEISDFRDSVFPAIVDFAKRSNLYIEQEYQRHFVVRLKNFINADKTEDPFADLSPHARYLIPCHLDKLCSQLSVSELSFIDDMKEDKINLEKYLSQQSVVDL